MLIPRNTFGPKSYQGYSWQLTILLDGINKKTVIMTQPHQNTETTKT